MNKFKPQDEQATGFAGAKRRVFWLDAVLLFLLALFAPLFFFPSMDYAWLFPVIPLVWMVRWFLRRELFERSMIDWAIGLLVAQVFTSCLVVSDIAVSLPKVAGVVFGILFFFGMINVLQSRKLMKLGVFGFAGAGLLLTVVGVLWMFTTRKGIYKRLAGDVIEKLPKINLRLPGAEAGINPNALAGVVVLFVPLFLAMTAYFLKKQKNVRSFLAGFAAFLAFFVGSIIACGVLFLTRSVGSWFAFAGGLGALIFWGRWKKWGGVVILILMALAILFNVYFLKSSGASTVDLKIELDKKRAIAIRFHLWQEGLEVIGKHPLTGIGMNQFRQLPEIGYEMAHAHNHLIHTAAELGIPGLVAYLAILMGAGFMCWEVARKNQDTFMRAAVVGLGAGQLAHFIFGMGDSIPLGAKPGIFFWVSLALITAMFHTMKREELAARELE